MKELLKTPARIFDPFWLLYRFETKISPGFLGPKWPSVANFGPIWGVSEGR